MQDKTNKTQSKRNLKKHMPKINLRKKKKSSYQANYQIPESEHRLQRIPGQ